MEAWRQMTHHRVATNGVVLFVTGAVLCTGCTALGSSSSSGGPAPAADGGVDGGVDGGSAHGGLAEVDAWLCTPWAQLLCAAAAGPCGCLNEGAQPVRQEDCQAQAHQDCMAVHQARAADFATGTRFIRQREAEQCLAAVAASFAQCLPLEVALSADCQFAVTGTEPLGQPCAYGACAEGSGVCINGLCTASGMMGGPCTQGCGQGLVCVEGVCLPPVTRGNSCTVDGQCAAGLMCGGGMCMAPQSGCMVDAECRPATLCQMGACTAVAQCQDVNGCGPRAACAVPVSLRCQAQRGETSPCTADRECVLSAACVEGACTALPGLDQPCANGTGCAKHLACRFSDGTCQPVPVDGQMCALGSVGPVVCASGLACLAGVCGPAPGQGQPCGLEGVCAAPWACFWDGANATCDAAVGAGALCTHDAECATGLFCNLGTLVCQGWLAVGSPCVNGNECGPDGSCIPDANGAHCRPLPGAGQTCLFDCSAGLFCGPVPGAGSCQPAVCGLVR